MYTSVKSVYFIFNARLNAKESVGIISAIILIDILKVWSLALWKKLHRREELWKSL